MATSRISLNIDENDIPCMLLPMVDTVILLPTVSIAEMAPMMPIEAIKNSPNWIYGYYDWRDHKVPLVSYEGLNGNDVKRLHKQGRIAVINNTGVNAKYPFIAIATQSIPRMARISEKDVQVDERVTPGSYDLMMVNVGVESLAMPNIQKIENRVIEFLESM